MEKKDPTAGVPLTLNAGDLPPSYPSYPNLHGGVAAPPPPAFVSQQPIATAYPPGTIVLTTSPAFPHPTYSPDPCQVQCPSCHSHVLTQVEYQSGSMTWLWSGALCLLGCWLGCCLIPFCINETQDVIHKCPNCNNVIGRYRRLH